MWLTMGRWLKAHRKAVLAHSLVLSSFLLYCVFLSGPLFDRLDVIHGEARLQNILLPAESEAVRFNIEQLEISPHIAEVQGSAFIDGQSSNNSRTYMVLKSDEKCYVFDTVTQLRTDVTTACSSLNLNLDWSGFHSKIPMRKISSGEYVIGIYVKKGDIEALRFTDRVLVKL